MTTSANNPASIAQSFSRSLGTPAVIALLLGNLLPIVGVMLWDWDVRSIVTLYWSENLILGVVTLVKMFHLRQLQATPKVLFFLVHYGAFCAAHGLFISEAFAPQATFTFGVEGSSFASGEQFTQFGPLGLFADAAMGIFGEASTLWWWAFCALATSHSVSFILNYLGHREFQHESIGSLMSSPYSRIFILHVTVLLGGIAVAELGSPVYLIVALVAVKIFVDVMMHNREHRRPGRAYSLPSDLTVETVNRG